MTEGRKARKEIEFGDGRSNETGSELGSITNRRTDLIPHDQNAVYTEIGVETGRAFSSTSLFANEVDHKVAGRSAETRGNRR